MNEQKSHNFVARMSAWFVNNSRASILILLVGLVAGVVSYTTLLQREGFPEIQFPIAFVQGTYFVDDVDEVSNKLTSPLEEAISGLEIVDTVSSTTTANSFSLTVRFNEDVTSEDGATEVERLVEKISLPQASNTFVSALNAGSADGEFGFMFSISNSKLDFDELQKEARVIARQLRQLDEVSEAEVKEQYEEQTNPFTGEVTNERVAFSRVIYKEEDELKFAIALNLGVNKAEEFDAVQLSDAVRHKLAELQEDGTIAEGTEFVYGYDIAVALKDQITSLEQNTISALFVIVVVVLLFINWRGAVVSALFLPFVLSVVFFLLYLFGFTLNVISLFALILVIGLLVDDIIVVVEAIDYEKRNGSRGLTAVKAAINKVGIADALGTLTTLAVFVPMLSIGGILGEFISLVPITVIATLIVSLISALTVFTWLSDLLLVSTKEKQAHGIIDRIGSFISKLIGLYAKSWPLVLSVIVASLLVMGVSISMFAPRLQFDIFPTEKDADALSIDVQFDDDDLTIAGANRRAIQIEEIIMQIGEYVEYGSYFGGYRAAGPDTSGYSLQLQLVPMSDREPTAPELVEILNADFKNYKNAEVVAQIVSVGPPSNEYPFQMQIFDNQTDDLRVAANQLRKFIKGYVYTDNEEAEISVESVLISDLDVISRKDGRRYEQLQVQFSEEDITTEVLQDLQSKIEEEFTSEKLQELGLSDSALEFDQGIESDNLESFRQTGVAFAAALVIMYGLLVVLFNSFTQPLLIFAAIPFALVGVIPGLVATDNPFSFFVMIGLIALAGIVVNNTILLVDYANQLRSEGHDLVESITQAIKIRFRPLATTSVTTIVGLLPLAVSDPFWESLAYTIIFGLTTSTLLVILAFPAYYLALESARMKLYGFFTSEEEA